MVAPVVAAAAIGAVPALLGGIFGSKKPKQAQPTEEMKAQAQIAREKWNRYVEVGIPVRNEAIAKLTGYRIDNETGNVSFDNGAFSPLDQEGNIKTDVSDARQSMEKQATADLYRNNDPNQSPLQSQESQNMFAEAGANSDMQMGHSQQTNHLQNINNVARMGQGLEMEITSDQQQLAAQAQNDAISAAGRAQAGKQRKSMYMGQALGAVGSGMMRHYDMNQMRAANTGNGVLPQIKNGQPS